MDVAIESFSIREYAEKMRSIEMGKCWPFGGEGEVKSRSLPPISWRKFRWWADEVEPERLDDEQGKVSFGGEDTCPTPVRPVGRGKLKVPKKRSIVEIFAAAPQIEAVEEDDDGEDEEREDLGEESGEENPGFELDEEVQERDHRRRAADRGKEIRLRGMKKQKKKKRITASEKVKPHTFKSQSVDVVSPISKCCSRKTKLTDPTGEHAKKKRAQVSKTGKKYKSIGASKFSAKKHDECRRAPSLRSILKKRIVSNKKTTVLANRLHDNHINSCVELIKHVSFSDKDDILGPDKNTAPKELPKVQTLCKVLFSDSLAASAAIKNSRKGEKHSVAVEGPHVEKVTMDVSTSAIRLADRPASEKNHSSDVNGFTVSTKDPSVSNLPDKVKNKIENSALNKNMQMHGNLSCPMSSDSISLDCHPHSINRMIVDSRYNDDLSSNIRSHVQKNTSNISAISSNSFHCRICVPRSDSSYSQTVTRNSVMQPSRSCLVSTMQNNNNCSLPSTVSNITEGMPAYLSSNCFLSGNHSSVGSMELMELMRASDPKVFSRDKITNEDFISLPLNSHGELVKLDSSCKADFNNPFTKHNIVPGSIHGSFVPTHMEPMKTVAQAKMEEMFPSESLYAKDLSQVLPRQYCRSEDHLTSGQVSAELQSFEGREAVKLESIRRKDAYKVSSNVCNLQNCTCQADIWNYHPAMGCGINVVPQPTMRLMGTTVTLGEFSKERKSFDDANNLTDKKITTKLYPKAPVYLGSFSYQWPEQEEFTHSALRTSPEKFSLSSQDHQTPHHIPLVGSKLDRHKSQIVFGIDSSIDNHGSADNNTGLHCHPSQVCLHLTQQPLVHCKSVKRPIESVHPKPVVASVYPETSNQWLLNSTHCKHTQSLSSNMSSMSNPLFRHTIPGCFAEPSSVCASPYLSQWQLDTKEPLNDQTIPFIRYPTPHAGYRPCTMPRTNFLSHPSTCSKSLIAMPVYNIQTSNTCGSTVSASLGHHSFVPGYPVNTSISTKNSNQASRAQNRAGPKSKINSLSDWNNCFKMKKRLAETGREFIRPLKRANVIFPIKSCSISRPVWRGEQKMLHPRNIGTTAVLHYGNETKNPDTQFLGYKNDAYIRFVKSSSKFCEGRIPGHVQVSKAEKNVSMKPNRNMNPSSSSPRYSSRIGPVKLRAGAKHLLKPCRNSDQKSSRLVHSIIPLVDGNASSGIVISHKKLKEIYSL